MATNNNSPDDSHLNKALEHLNSVLVTGETIEAWAIQRRLFAITSRRILIAATSGRFIKIKRGLLGGFDMTDLAISKDSNQVLMLPGFRKEQAEQIYRLAQAQDQSWREKRRIRELEELRAKSGGITIGPNTGMQQPGNIPEDAAAKLAQAKQMLDNKLITDSEFESIKARIISGL